MRQTSTMLVLACLAACGVATTAAAASGTAAPEQIHVHSATNDTKDGRFKVMWVHQAPLEVVTQQHPAVVTRSTSSAPPSAPIAAACHTYTWGGFEGTICMAEVALTNATIEYQVGSTSLGWSDWTLLRGVGRTDAVSLLAWADMGTDWGNTTLKALAADAATGQYSAVLATGDMSYANDRCPAGVGPTICNNSYVWDDFFRQAQPHLSGAAGPFVQIPGNHERADGFAAYLNRTWSTTRFCYSTAIGPATVVSFSTEHDVSPGSFIHDCVAGLLQEAASPKTRAERPWIITQSHHPLLCTSLLTWGERCSPTSEAPRFRAALEPLFIEAGVDLFFSGHDHNAEASWPYRNGTVSKSLDHPEGTVYVVNGAAGDIEGVDPFFVPNPGYRMIAGDIDGLNTSYTRVHINMSHLELEWIDSHTGNRWGGFTLSK